MADSQQRYRVVEKLESGGMAEVFRAESEGLQGFKKQVAIKRVLPHLSEKKKFISMFLDEARLSAHLSHSNCVQVFDIGVGDNAYFIVMEFVEGANLKSITEWIKKTGRDLPVQNAVFIALEICKGLSYAHELRDPNGVDLHIVHRDMSPPNVLVTKFGEIKIVDFGLAKANSQLEKSEPGIIKGKFSYLSPEAAMGQDVDSRTDIFAVGIILWEMLAGQRLFLGDTDFQTVKKVQEAKIPSLIPINKNVTPELERIVMRSLARDPMQRYRTARELGKELSDFLFAYGQPVSDFDIATLVQGAMRERQRVRPPQASIIDKLIEEALLEFTSLKPGEEDVARTGNGAPMKKDLGGNAALNLGDFEDPSKWLSDVQIADVPRPPTSAEAFLPHEALREGNLASLEDIDSDPEPIPSRGPTPIPPESSANPMNLARPMTSTNVAASPLTAPARMATPQEGHRPERYSAPVLPNILPVASRAPEKKSSAIVGVVVAAVAILAVAALWLTHIIPHK